MTFQTLITHPDDTTIFTTQRNSKLTFPAPGAEGNERGIFLKTLFKFPVLCVYLTVVLNQFWGLH